MPVFIQLANLVFNKQLLDKKYLGGCTQFRIDWNIDGSLYNQEDDELFCISAMNENEFDIKKLIEHGLEFNTELNSSNDFVAITRYRGKLWQTEWLNNNDTFAWHSLCNQEQIDKAVEIGEVMTMDKIQDLAEKGINVFETIKTYSSKI